MPRLHARHRTEIRYADGVSHSVNAVRMAPMRHDRQQPEAFTLDVTPAAAVSAERDVFGNAVHRFTLPELHDTLVVEARAVVTTRPLPTPDAWAGAGLDAIDAPGYAAEHAGFLTPSRHVRWGEPVEALARSLSLPEGGGAVAWLRALETAVGEAIDYAPGATRVDTPVEDVVRRRRGVCQDMAHLLIALCRRRGVAARYVSGWMHQPGRRGPGASHAWAEAAVPGHGWLEVDPTNPGRSLERYVRLAVGRDYDDVPPLRGRFRGPTSQEMTVTVEMGEEPT